jgi:hypothetical protein
MPMSGCLNKNGGTNDAHLADVGVARPADPMLAPVRVEHSAVGRLYGRCRACMVIELMDGRSLMRPLDGGPIPVA